MSSELGTLGILVLDDEPNVRRAIARLDLGPAMRVHAVGTTAEADALVATGTIDVALVDQHLGIGQLPGLEWLDLLRARDPDCFRIIFTGAADLDFAVRAINGGVIDAFLTKPWSDGQALALMHQGAEACLLRRHNRALLQELSQRNTDLLSFNENLERLVQERTHNLREAHERLKQQQQAMIRLETQGVVNHLARGLAHELNNPLAVILGYAQRLKRGGGEPDTLRRLDVILAEVERCRGLVDQLRRIAAPLDEETVAVSPAAQLDDVLSARREGGQSVPRLLTRRPPPAVIAAPAALRRVLAEIVDNAMRAGATVIELDGEVAFGRATLRLTNDGAKPSLIEAENATKPFFTTRSAEGARGLGLAVAAGLLGDQEGHLELQTDATGRAMVVIQLPAATSPVAAGHRSVVAAASEERSILVVDDDILVGELLADMLHDLNCRAVLARTCGEARERLATGQFKAILTDQHLPDGSGADLLADCAQRGLRGAMITGDIPGERTYPVLGKPFRYEQVAELLQQLDVDGLNP
jgi:signal transduction histidine kinase